VEIVLGVSMTPTTVRMALVEGEKADGVILEHDVFDITAIDGSATSNASDDVIAAILGTQEGAIANGHHLVSTGVAWSDHAEAAALREALEARGIEDVLLVSELHAASALAQAVGRAVGYETTALMFLKRDTATLAVVETADGSAMKVLSQGHSLHSADPIAVLAEMVTSLEAEEFPPQGMFVVGSNVDVTSVKSYLQGRVSVPVIAPMEPQLALPRGAALASASAPRFDTSTIGLAYSQEAGATVFHPMALANDATEPLGSDDASTDADTVFHLADVQTGREPFALVGSALAAVFAVGVTVLAITMAVALQPTAEQATDALKAPPSVVVPPTVRSPLPAAPQPAPQTVPEPAPVAPSAAAAATARLMVPPAPPPRPRVVVQNAAPAPAAPAPAPPVPPPAVLPAPLIPWLPPILQPPPLFVPPAPGPPWYPVLGPWGHGGHRGHRGHGD
jgi:hypothetical protein